MLKYYIQDNITLKATLEATLEAIYIKEYIVTSPDMCRLQVITCTPF